MKVKKAIILAGGKASRLYPVTSVISKHLLPIYNRPMIYYPISTLMLGGIRKFLIITNPSHLNLYKDLLGDGTKFGISIEYLIQKKPRGLPEAFLLGKKFIGNDPICLNLGDHIFFGEDVTTLLKKNLNNFKKTTLFAYKTKNTKNFGVIIFDKKNKPLSIKEKPLKSKSKFIITGLYIYKNNVVNFSKKLKFSNRNELEISDLNNLYLRNNALNVEIVNNKNNYWIDAGTSKNILKASKLISFFENRYNNYIGCLEIIAFQKSFIGIKQFKKFTEVYKGSDYGETLNSFLNKF